MFFETLRAGAGELGAALANAMIVWLAYVMLCLAAGMLVVSSIGIVAYLFKAALT